MSTESFVGSGSDAQQTLQSFWPRVMEEIRNLTVVGPVLPRLRLLARSPHLSSCIFSDLRYLKTLLASLPEGLSRAGVTSRPNQENHEAG